MREILPIPHMVNDGELLTVKFALIIGGSRTITPHG